MFSTAAMLTPRSYLEALLRELAIDTVLDVGANTGQFAKAVRSAGFRGTIHSFEPVSRSFAVLSEAARGDKHWRCHQVALGDAAGIQEINLTKKTVYQSLLQPSAFGLENYASLSSASTEGIRVERLEGFVAASGEDFGDRWLLKMDTQGYDLKVFDGARGCLDKIVALASEIAFQQIYVGMPDYAESLSHYRKHGFVPSAIYAVARRGLTLVEADCFLVRETESRS
jgi:FkbM family methyltransferase